MQLDRIDARIVQWMADHSIQFLRAGMGTVFLWFGALKLFPNASPAESLVVQTTEILTMGMIQPEVSLVFVAVLECIIGLGMLTGKFLRMTLLLLAFQMSGALAPLVLFPEVVFTSIFLMPTLEGQYIIKNLVLIGAALVLGATARGGSIVPEAYNNIEK